MGAHRREKILQSPWPAHGHSLTQTRDQDPLDLTTIGRRVGGPPISRPCNARGGVARTTTASPPTVATPIFSPIGRSPHNPWRAVKRATALSLFAALWSPGRRGSHLRCAAAPIFSSVTGHPVQALPGPLYTSDARGSAVIPSNSSCAQVLCGYRVSGLFPWFLGEGATTTPAEEPRA
jgi:hypothetical protein